MPSRPGTHVVWVLPDLGHYHDARLRAFVTIPDVAATVLEVHGQSRFGQFRLANRDDVPYDIVTAFPEVSLTRSPAESDVGEVPDGRRELARRLGEHLAALDPDVVCVNGWSDLSALATLAWCERTGTPAVLMSESQANDAPRRWLAECVKRQIVSAFGSALVSGSRHARYLEDLGFDRSGVFLGYSAVDNEHFSRGAREARASADGLRKAHDLPERYLLASGRFVKRKNYPGLVEAFARHCRGALDSGWSLVILGDGPERAEIERRCADQGIAERVVLPGFRSHAQLPTWYGLAEAFVHPATSEQWGLVVNEAMAAGLPVVVSRACGCVPELVIEDRNGHVVDGADGDSLLSGLDRLSADGGRRVSMGRESETIISRWSSATFGAGLHQAVAHARKAHATRRRGRLFGIALWAARRGVWRSG